MCICPQNPDIYCFMYRYRPCIFVLIFFTFFTDKSLWKCYFLKHLPWFYLNLCMCLGALALYLWEGLLVHVSVPAIVCLLSSLLYHSCLILRLSHQIWRIGLAKLLTADSSLYATSISVCTQICQGVSTKMCDVHLSFFLCLCIHTFHFDWHYPMQTFFFDLPFLVSSIDISVCNMCVNDHRKSDATQRDSANLSHGLQHHHSFSSPSSGSQWQRAAKYRV